MVTIAVQRATVGWEFQEDTDKSFIKKYQAVFKQQSTQWASVEAPITGALIDMNPIDIFPKPMVMSPRKLLKRKRNILPKVVNKGVVYQRLICLNRLLENLQEAKQDQGVKVVMEVVKVVLITVTRLDKSNVC